MTPSLRRTRRCRLAVAAVVVLSVTCDVADTAAIPSTEVEEVVVLLDDSSAPIDDMASVADAAGVDPDRVAGATVSALDAAALELTAAERDAVDDDARVRAVIERGHTASVALAGSTSVVGAPPRWATGETGAGRTIGVIDSGVHRDFGGSIVGQACIVGSGDCAAPAVSAAFDGLCFAVGLCGPGDVSDPEAGRPCGVAPFSATCQHGSAVAAVAARHTEPRGVAPDADVYAVRVVDSTTHEADLADILLAVEHLIAMHDAGAVDLAAVNISLGTQLTFAGACDHTSEFGPDMAEAYLTAFARLRARDIAPVVASGNGYRADQLSFPACLSNAIAVGASDGGDLVADFSNRGPGVDLMAPGVDRVPQRGVDPLDVPSAPGFDTQHVGTSFAAPHVAGAFTLLDERLPLATVDQRLGFVLAHAAVATDGMAVFPRLDLDVPSPAFVPTPVAVPDSASWAGTADIDGDGVADLVATAGSAIVAGFGDVDAWTHQTAVVASASPGVPLVGRFRGATTGPDDILVYRPGTAADEIWSGDPSRHLDSMSIVVGGTYEPVVGDFDGDGYDDVFWYAPGPAPDYVWYFDGVGYDSRPMSVSGRYRVVAGDFDGDGRDDLFFHGPGPTIDSLWLSTATRTRPVDIRLVIGGEYEPTVFDVGADGTDDLLLYAPGGRPDYVWTGNATLAPGRVRGGFAQASVRVDGHYEVVPADVTGDGLEDLVWNAPGSAPDYVWVSTPGLRWTSVRADVPSSRILVAGDLDGSGTSDLIAVGDDVTALWAV